MPQPRFQSENAGAKEAEDGSGRALEMSQALGWQVLRRAGNKETEHRGTNCRSLYEAVDPARSPSCPHVQWSTARHSAVITSVSENTTHTLLFLNLSTWTPRWVVRETTHLAGAN